MEREQLDFYTQAAHELRTPLTLIEGPLDLLAATPTISEAPESAAELFAIVRRNTNHLSGLVNKILDMQAGKRCVGGVADGDGTDVATWREPIAMQPSASQSLNSEQEEMPTILIVDDNADVRAYLRNILQTDYQVFEAEDGKQGLTVAREQVPDLIVSDVMMPVMDGLEFCQQVKSDFVTSHIPVILLTARALSSHQIEGYESGADAYITKPFEKELLQARIANLLHSRKVLKDLWGSKDEEKEAASEETAVPTMEAVADAQPPSSPFVARFKSVVEARLSDSNLSVEDLGADMGLSRVQLYRKVKALTGSTPVDLIRKARLAKARELLQGTDLTVSEVAYKVGFTTPSYFTKCFKDEYGRVPGDVRDEKE